VSEPRKCAICGRFLSRFNKADVCWCHKEHPENGGVHFDEPIIERSKGVVGFNVAQIDYYGTING
jgi:hypothetical protein